jgi:hypothetical protein
MQISPKDTTIANEPRCVISTQLSHGQLAFMEENKWKSVPSEWKICIMCGKSFSRPDPDSTRTSFESSARDFRASFESSARDFRTTPEEEAKSLYRNFSKLRLHQNPREGDWWVRCEKGCVHRVVKFCGLCWKKHISAHMLQMCTCTDRPARF